MSRIVLLALAVLVLVGLLRRALSGRKSDDPRAADRQAGPPAPGAAVPELVACAHCGVHLPKNEAIAQEGAAAPAATRFFCCEEHRRLGSA